MRKRGGEKDDSQKLKSFGRGIKKKILKEELNNK